MYYEQVPRKPTLILPSMAKSEATKTIAAQNNFAVDKTSSIPEFRSIFTLLSGSSQQAPQTVQAKSIQLAGDKKTTEQAVPEKSQQIQTPPPQAKDRVSKQQILRNHKDQIQKIIDQLPPHQRTSANINREFKKQYNIDGIEIDQPSMYAFLRKDFLHLLHREPQAKDRVSKQQILRNHKDQIQKIIDQLPLKQRTPTNINREFKKQYNIDGIERVSMCIFLKDHLPHLLYRDPQAESRKLLKDHGDEIQKIIDQLPPHQQTAANINREFNRQYNMNDEEIDIATMSYFLGCYHSHLSHSSPQASAYTQSPPMALQMPAPHQSSNLLPPQSTEAQSWSLGEELGMSAKAYTPVPSYPQYLGTPGMASTGAQSWSLDEGLSMSARTHTPVPPYPMPRYIPAPHLNLHQSGHHIGTPGMDRLLLNSG